MAEIPQVYEVTQDKGILDLMKELEPINVIGQFPLPTEVILKDMSPVFPLAGRILEIKGVSILDKVIVELWQNWGEDGHTDMVLRGFVVVKSKDILVNNDSSFMKTTSWLQDWIEEQYLIWYKDKITKGKEAK